MNVSNQSAEALTSGLNESTPPYKCSGASDQELVLFGALSFWIGGIVQALICLIGLVANTISIPVLRSKDLYTSTFNRLLIVLAVIDNLYLCFAGLEIIRTELEIPTGNWHVSIFAHALYPSHNIMLCLSIYMTVILAMERYRAVTKPIDYHTVIVSGKQWERVFRYVIPVVVFSITFNMPKFFELQTNEVPIDNGNETDDNATAETRLSIAPTELRLNDDYTTHYNHNLRILFTGVIPLVALAYFNYQIYVAFKQRRQNMRGIASGSNQHQQATEENRQAIILFAIVVLFFVCHLFRNVLSLHEALTFEQKKQDYFHGCGGMPFGILVVGLVSHLLLTCNSACNFFLYCAMSDQFRNELKKILKIQSSSPTQSPQGPPRQPVVTAKDAPEMEAMEMVKIPAEETKENEMAKETTVRANGASNILVQQSNKATTKTVNNVLTTSL